MISYRTAAVENASQFTHMIDEVTEERETGSEFGMVDVAVQRLVHCKDEFRHAAKPPFLVLQDSVSRGRRIRLSILTAVCEATQTACTLTWSPIVAILIRFREYPGTRRR
jgi:hypothetical protein